MSESNKKKNSIFKLVIIYFVVAIVVTTIAVVFHKINGFGIIEYFLNKNIPENTISNEVTIQEDMEEDIEENIDTDNIRRISLSDTYKKNNLEIEEETNEYGEEIYYENDYTTRKVRISYSQISGLKDKNIENKINKKIEEKCESLVASEEANNDEIESIVVSTWVSGSFSNILSINISKYVYYEDMDTDSYYDTINLKLDTGEEISFEEMFTPDVSFKNIITQSAYNSMSKKIKQEYEFSDNFEEENIDYSQVENLTYKILNEFEKSDDKKFYFSPFSIFLITSFGDIEIPMVDFYEYINIFNLAVSEEPLFEPGDVSSEAYVFGEDYSAGMEFDGKISDYIYLTVYNYDKFSYETFEQEKETEIPESLKIYEENLDKIKNCLKNYEKSLNSNKGAFYNINLCYHNEENNIVFDCQRLEVEKTDFDKNVEEIYQKTTRNNNYVELFFSFEDNENTERYELILKDGELEIKEYVEPEW